ncbi:MAG: alanine--tRNA ligase [Bacteroidales bacterium]|nr:alanine--tRNA ligase [Bacteroidales bacterium]
MTSQEIRQAFLDFFKEKEHQILPSAPMVLKNDPTLMFTNAGMNQFKDYFLGTRKPSFQRVCDTQKCLRVAGKHNDLEEVGHDTYHHTMFEMLGNWSFGDYFKKEAIGWAWEFLTERMKLKSDRIFVTVFEGDPLDGVDRDQEAFDYWRELLPSNRILNGSKKDNFWEMGDTGPCGPCSEIHLDLRDEADRKKVPGVELVNRNHPLVIEIWNLVFIQFNRKAGGELENLPEKHVDTGMGFERLCMAIQQKKSNYDTDLFQALIGEIARLSGTPYGSDPSSDVAMRVVADHLRAISFSIADGQLPSNNKAGYVIRRILRRAVRYGFTYLGQKEAFMHTLIPTLVQTMGKAFPELDAQQELIMRVIREEELSFLSTLETGIGLLDRLVETAKAGQSNIIHGKEAFTLYDTFGFPLDLTQLILSEKGMKVNLEEFQVEMEKQKSRSRKAAETESGDWTILLEDKNEEFVGYDRLSTEVKISRYRKVLVQKKEQYHLVFNITPFYAESGGQVGDRGFIENEREKVEIIDTRKENELIIHVSKKLPEDPAASFIAKVDLARRTRVANNHTATHLMHHALREVLGEHVEQKGSLVEPDYLRFDFSHFQKVSDEELRRVEHLVNRMIRQNSSMEEHRAVPKSKAEEMGALALFGEKYGDAVRVIKFGESVELCGGTHVAATGQIGIFRIFRESSVAAGIRRIEAFTGEAAERYLDEHVEIVRQIAENFENQKDVVRAVRSVLSEHGELVRQVGKFQKNMLGILARNLEDRRKRIGDISLVTSRVELDNPGLLRDLAFQVRSRHPGICLILGAEIDGKAHLAFMLSEVATESYGLNASTLIREVAGEIRGGGGGQPFFATAGGKNPSGIDKALSRADKIIREAVG